MKLFREPSQEHVCHTKATQLLNTRGAPIKFYGLWRDHYDAYLSQKIQKISPLSKQQFCKRMIDENDGLNILQHGGFICIAIEIAKVNISQRF